jgi:hypothetical protein
MTTSASNAAALIAHIEAKNAEGAAWAAEADASKGEWRCAAEYSVSPEYWAEFGVTTPAEFDLYLVHTSLYDYHKEVRGFRPNWTWVKSLSLAEAEDYIDSLSAEWEANAEEREAENAYYRELEAQWLDDDRIAEAKYTGDWEPVNAAHREEYTTSQAPLGSIGLVLDIAC